MSKRNVLDNHILNIVQSHIITEQSELQKLLLGRGLEVPQASLSRRLKKLGIVKVAGRYNLLSAHSLESLPRVTHMKRSDFGMLVLHTAPGNASSLAYYLDSKYVCFSGSEPSAPFLGTIAGDDTVLVVTQSKESLDAATKLLQSLFPYLD